MSQYFSPHRISLLQRNAWTPNATEGESLGPRSICLQRFFNASEGLSQAWSVKLVLRSSEPTACLMVNGHRPVSLSPSPECDLTSQSVQQLDGPQATIQEAFEIGPYLQKRNLLILGWRLDGAFVEAHPSSKSPTAYLTDIFLEITS